MSLVLDVSGLEHEVGQALKFEISGEAPEGPSRPEGVGFGPITVSGRAMWTGETVLVEGQARTLGEFTCGRCCQPFDQPVTAELSRQFRPTGETAGPDGRTRPRRRPDPEEGAAAPTLGDGDDPPLPYDGERIDLGLAVWEAIVLELPMKPVCRPDCAGLCPVCGADLNEKACGCQAEKADSRFLSLKKLLRAKERGE